MIEKSWGTDGWGSPVSEDTKILAQLKLEADRGKDAISMLFDAVQQTDNQELYNNLVKADNKFGYDVLFHRSLGLDNNKVDPNRPTLASTQQAILKGEIDELDEVENISLQTVLEMEIKKFLYDKISFQKHFVDHRDSEYDTYELTPEDIEFSESFRSDLDGATERLGGKIGIVGPGNRIYSLENAPHLVNENVVKKMYLPDVSFDELQDYRLELWAEKLNIAQTREFLNQWSGWTYNAYYKQLFPEGDEASFENAIEEIKKHLDEKEQGLIDKYKLLESEKETKKKNSELIDKENESTSEITIEENKSEIEEQVEQKTDEVEKEELGVDKTLENADVEKIETSISSKESLKGRNDLWMNRFNGWYSAIDRVSQSVKDKFVKMKSDIIKAISEKLKERNNHRQVDTQEQDTNER